MIAPPTVDIGPPPPTRSPRYTSAVVCGVLGVWMAVVTLRGALDPEPVRWSDDRYLPMWTAWTGTAVGALIAVSLILWAVRRARRVRAGAVPARPPLGTPAVSIDRATRLLTLVSPPSHPGGPAVLYLLVEEDRRVVARVACRTPQIGEPALHEAVRWWQQRPGLVTDEDTARVLTDAAYRLAGRASAGSASAGSGSGQPGR